MALKPRTKEVHLIQGDDLNRLDELQQELAVAERRAQSSNRRMGSTAATPEMAKQALEDFRVEAAERAVTVTLKSLGGRRWRDLVADHPPRSESRTIDGGDTDVVNQNDAPWGINTRTFPEALLRYASQDDQNARTIVAVSDPDLSVHDLSWLDEIAGGEYERLWVTAYGINAGAGADPKDWIS